MFMLKWKKKALCFEYLHGGSLDKHLSGMIVLYLDFCMKRKSHLYLLCLGNTLLFISTDESCGLGWHRRCKIIKGICEGLYYLHKGFKDPIYHLDLKPTNILLDKNMVPKIGDFGLSRLFDSTTTCITKGIIGTP
jgi:pyruvate dehydrogenase phosphatase